jgi:hypothetical protein
MGGTVSTVAANRAIRTNSIGIAIVVIFTTATMLPRQTANAAPTVARPGVGPSTPELVERAVRRGDITDAQGALYLTWAFTAPHRVPEAYVSDTPWSGTLPLLRLRERIAALGDSPTALAARSEFRGATFACPGTSGSLPNRRSSAHFYIQYKASALQALTIARYASALETTWATEIGTFKWAKPPRDPVSAPPGGRYPVRVENLGAGLYGYVTSTRLVGNNPATPWNDRDAAASCMVLNRNFGQFAPSSALDALRATAAHEFNHSIQFGYGALHGFGNVSDVMVEGLATEMEDEVFDSSNDSYNYLWPSFRTPMGRYGASPYPYWVVFRAMAERFGTGVRGGAEDVYQVFWEQISRGASTNLAALSKGFKANGTTLGKAYHDASIAARFLQDCSATPRRHCLEEGPAYAAAAGPNGDHASLNAAPDTLSKKIANDYALNWIGLPTGGAFDLSVTLDGGRGVLRVSLACRSGAAVSVTSAGTATSSRDAVVNGFDPGTCDEVSAVISNVRQTAPSPRTVTRTRYTTSIT